MVFSPPNYAGIEIPIRAGAPRVSYKRLSKSNSAALVLISSGAREDFLAGSTKVFVSIALNDHRKRFRFFLLQETAFCSL